jgi:hypothetical protein
MFSNVIEDDKKDDKARLALCMEYSLQYFSRVIWRA